MKNARERMDIMSAYQQVGTYRGAAELCGTTHKTVRRVVQAAEAVRAGQLPARRARRDRNTDPVADLVASRVAATSERISAKRLLPEAATAGYAGSARNFRRLVSAQKRAWKATQAQGNGRRPAVWSPGRVLVIDWGMETVAGRLVHVFCAVLAWSRYRFVRFADNEKATTTLGFLAECFEELGGVPAVVLADRMGCLKGGVVANLVVPTPEYVRFATHHRFRPDFCNGADPESKGIVENLVGYAKDDLMVPLELVTDLWAGGYAGLNARARAWGEEVNAARHSEICAVPAERLVAEREHFWGSPRIVEGFSMRLPDRGPQCFRS